MLTIIRNFNTDQKYLLHDTYREAISDREAARLLRTGCAKAANWQPSGKFLRQL